MLFPPIDPNERFRARRAAVRRRKRLRRGALIGTLLVGVALLGAGAQLVGGSAPAPESTWGRAKRSSLALGPRPLPLELRGVHVTIGLASLPGKLEEYVDLERDGLTALELDVKDENGQVGFTRPVMPLANASGAARDFYDARGRLALVHERGLYLVGRVVVFEDPVLSRAGPTWPYAGATGRCWRDVRVSGGRIRTTGESGGTTWTSPWRPQRPASTRFSSTTRGFRRTATSTRPCTRIHDASPGATPFRRSFSTRTVVWSRRHPCLRGGIRSFGSS